MIKLAVKLILLCSISMIGSISYSQPIIVLEYRGTNYQNQSEDQSNNIFIIDPDHS